jgi:predicted porin
MSTSLLAGVGLQSRYDKDNPFQFFGQLLGGTNAHGPIVKAGIGMNYGLSDRLAIYASAGKTVATSSNKTNFRSDNVGLGLTYRFSMPSW